MAVEMVTVKPDDADMRLDRWFQKYYDLNFAMVQKKCRKGEIRLDGKRVKGNERVSAGMVVRVPPMDKKITNPNADKVYNPEDAELIKSMVIHKDDDIIAINKPAGIPVQGGTNTLKHIDHLTRYLHRDNQDKPRLVHRLDKDTSGVLLLARNRKSANDLGDLFKRNKPRKVYWAVIVGEPDMDSGQISAPLIKKNMGGQEKVVVDEDEGKNAITEFEVLQRMGGVLTLVALYPLTGRTHQLRAHMQYMGTPILGDGKYGGKDSFVSNEAHTKKMHLHARLIDTGDLNIVADISGHMKDTFKMFDVNIEPHFDSVFEDLK
ncbi:MAG: RluA family pseudouridine synthase [Alphaproteobacteria bacterium]